MYFRVLVPHVKQWRNLITVPFFTVVSECSRFTVQKLQNQTGVCQHIFEFNIEFERLRELHGLYYDYLTEEILDFSKLLLYVCKITAPFFESNATRILVALPSLAFPFKISLKRH